MLMLRFSELITGPITGINESESNTTFELNKIVGYNNYAIYSDIRHIFRFLFDYYQILSKKM